ncbi:hypothetical protein TRAPUB_3254 [Trametes pubescens]|uniref:Xylanolytic transcriptional activator regulatory domain-containing protein n=1 Tax=Trametes pubescens TaxID=154538 RepID=A0A1M2VEA1_TRAPU|nr:hypothetical protein TRAPUB_3254 [Trametes pubescens]
MAGLPCNDRALLAQGTSGSSVVINLEDVASLWLNELEDEGSDPKAARTSAQDTYSSPMRPSTSSVSVKLEPTAASIPPSSFSVGSQVTLPVGSLRTLHPPAPYDVFLPPPSAGPSALPQVTAALVAYLPAEPERARYLKAFRETMLLHPCFNVPHFEQRIAAIFVWAEGGSMSVSTGPMSKAELARDIFFSSSKGNGSTSKKDQTRASASGPPPGSGEPDRNAPKPTLSFFAAASAAFALGALISRDEGSERSAPLPPGAPPPSPSSDAVGTSATLFALSEQALQLSEKTAAYDPDSIMTMVLQVLFMLHEGQMSVAQSVFPLVGKMVNVARMMGLAIDPDEFPGTFNLFEAESRRRLWWDVIYYDLFVADCMGHPPLIADNTHTTRLPADVDEEKFTPSSTSLPTSESADGDTSSVYFGLKCRLAQLVKNVKKQTFKDPLGEDAADLSIDSASNFEGDVTVFLQELPSGFHLEMTQDMSKPLPPLSGSPFRLAQKCELAILAQRLIMKLYLPFLKEAVAQNKPAHQAVFGTITAAHNIIYASRLLHSVWGQTRPAVFDFYDFGRTLFDAAVVCAHAVIQEPNSIIATEGMKSVTCALDVLRELGSSRLGVEGAHAEKNGAGSRSEAVRIVEAMKRKADAARGGGSASSASAGTKRKHAEVESEPLVASSGFQLPFVGASVSSSKPERPRPSAAGASSSRAAPAPSKEPAAANGEGKPKPEAKKPPKDREKEKGKERSGPKVYDGPLRVRPMTGQPNPRRPRTSSVSTAAGATPAPSAPPPAPPARAAPPPPSPLTSTIQTSLPNTSNRASVSVPESPSVSTPYENYPPPPPTAPNVHEPMQQQQEDYNMQYNSGDDIVDDRRYSAQSSYDSPQSAVMYEPQQQGRYAQQSSSAYPPTPSQQGYYLQYPSDDGPSPAYASSPAVHTHPLTMNMVGPSPLTSNGPNPGGIAPTMTTMPHGHEQQQQQQQPQHYMQQPQDRSHHSSYGHPSHPHMAEQGRQVAPHEYAPPPSSHGHGHGHGHPHPPMPVPSHVQGWPQQGSPGPPPGADMWGDYKFYNMTG